MAEENLKRYSFSACWTEKLGEALLKNATENEKLEGPYSITPNRDQDMQTSLSNATAQGIDARLEAIFFTEKAGTYYFDPNSLSVLVRRLLSSGEDEDMSLASCICETLNIELI